MPHVGDHRAVEVGGADFLAAHRLEKGPAVGGQGKRVRGPGNRQNLLVARFLVIPAKALMN